MRRRSLVAAWVLAAATLAGCGGRSGGGTATTDAGDAAPRAAASPTAEAAEPAPEDQPHGEIVVFAAAPLSKAFTTLGRRFQSAHPGVTVRFRFGASDALAAEIVGGTPADVLAAASAATMQSFVDAGSVARAPATFVRDGRPDGSGNEYQIAPLADSSNIVTAAAFVDLVVSDKGRQVLQAAGFELL
jgi:molybdate transport system substrate-binding protein